MKNKPIPQAIRKSVNNKETEEKFGHISNIVVAATEKLQDELHEFATEIHKERPDGEYQDTVTLFMLLQIAKINEAIDEMKQVFGE